jgi:hypothetical protein
MQIGGLDNQGQLKVTPHPLSGEEGEQDAHEGKH